MLAMGHTIVPFVQHLFPVFMAALKDEDDEVRSNAIYGLGLLAFYGGDLITPYPCMHVYYWRELCKTIRLADGYEVEIRDAHL